MNNTKVFITGTARGGTTVISRMLSANKDINVAISPFLEILRLQRNLVLNKFIELFEKDNINIIGKIILYIY